MHATRRSRWGWLWTAIGILLITTGVPVSAVAAQAGTGSPPLSTAIITAYSALQPYAVVQEFDPTNSAVTGTATTTGGLNLTATGGTTAQALTIAVTPPTGSSLHAGYYTKVSGYPDSEHAGLSLSTLNCGPFSGRLEVRDLAVSGTTITRIDVLYEEHCGPTGPMAVGEIRIGEPRPAGLIFSSGSLVWPTIPGMELGQPATAIPVYVRNPGTSAVSIGAASVTGAAPGEFDVADNTCSGTRLPGGFSCALYVRFLPKAKGPRAGVLSLRLGTHTANVQLDALVNAGTTSLVMQSQKGDPAGRGKNYDLTPANSVFAAGGDRSGVTAYVGLPGSVATWTAEMIPGLVGTYANAVYPFNSTNPGLLVDGVTRCRTATGSFTVKQAVFSPAEGSPEHFDATFTQHCDRSKAALTGELKYSAEPDTAPPAPVSGLKAARTSSGLDITWMNPAISDYSYTMVRLEETGNPVGVAPFSGIAAAEGTGTSASVNGLSAGTYTVVAYTVDKYGNVSNPVRLKVAV